MIEYTGDGVFSIGWLELKKGDTLDARQLSDLGCPVQTLEVLAEREDFEKVSGTVAPAPEPEEEDF